MNFHSPPSRISVDATLSAVTTRAGEHVALQASAGWSLLISSAVIGASFSGSAERSSAASGLSSVALASPQTSRGVGRLFRRSRPPVHRDTHFGPRPGSSSTDAGCRNSDLTDSGGRAWLPAARDAAVDERGARYGGPRPSWESRATRRRSSRVSAPSALASSSRIEKWW